MLDVEARSRHDRNGRSLERTPHRPLPAIDLIDLGGRASRDQPAHQPGRPQAPEPSHSRPMAHEHEARPASQLKRMRARRSPWPSIPSSEPGVPGRSAAPFFLYLFLLNK
jgi:hypothetical protein